MNDNEIFEEFMNSQSSIENTNFGAVSNQYSGGKKVYIERNMKTPGSPISTYIDSKFGVNSRPPGSANPLLQ